MIPFIDWRDARIVYDDLFDLLTAPLNDAAFMAAVRERGEDLLQIELPHHYLIDVGWYGGFSPNAALRVVAVYQHDWEHCVFTATAHTAAQTIAVVERAAQVVAMRRRGDGVVFNLARCAAVYPFIPKSKIWTKEQGCLDGLYWFSGCLLRGIVGSLKTKMERRRLVANAYYTSHD